MERCERVEEPLFSPKEPPPPEAEWSDQQTDVLHLTDESFKPILKKKKAALVFFYAPCELLYARDDAIV